MSNPTISFIKFPPPDPSSDEAAVLAVIEGLLDAVPSKDAASLLRYCHPGCGAARMRGPGQLLVETLEQVCHGISGLQGEVWERFVEPDVKVSILSNPFLFFFPATPTTISRSWGGKGGDSEFGRLRRLRDGVRE